MIKFSFLTLIILILHLGCNTNDDGPELVLKKFIESRVGNVVDREFILENVTGKIKQSFENTSEEDFKKILDLKNIKKGSFKVLSKSCQNKTCYLTYSVSYQTLGTTTEVGKKIVSTEVKKIAEMINYGGRWLIADVTNIKTYHDFLTPLDP